ncbi:MAG: hypothetical protein GY724_19075 [Actinomycetia bacterium]|nr:hypothetical protein [Actinomycetes bacterium]MCP5034845.1 hypothetical protein [Actinomycetes bacterium]
MSPRWQWWAARIGLLVALVVVGLGCSPDDSLERSSPTTPHPSTTSATVASSEDDEIVQPPTAEVMAELVDLPGRLAVGNGVGLSVLAPDGTEIASLQDTPDVLVSQPTWSNDGTRLAWSRASVDDQELVVSAIDGSDEVVTPIDGPIVFYLQWSADDHGLVYLRTHTGGQGVEMGLIEPGMRAIPVAVTEPLFVAWAPTSSTVAMHVAARQVVVVPDVFAAPGPAPDPDSAPDDQAVVVVDPTGGFTAPAWVDDRTLLVATAEGLALVDVETKRSVVQVPTEGRVQFLLSPDRSKVAYRILGDGADSPVVVRTHASSSLVPVQNPAPTGGGLGVFDLASGETTVVTDLVPLAWEWSPDSTRLAWLDAGFPEIHPRTRWQFWDGAISVPSAEFDLSDRIRASYLLFFEQYAQSQQRWSPDSRAFAFAGRLRPDEPGDGIWVQLVGVDAPPVRIADGDDVTWSSR